MYVCPSGGGEFQGDAMLAFIVGVQELSSDGSCHGVNRLYWSRNQMPSTYLNPTPLHETHYLANYTFALLQECVSL